jgi:hypothetical protein
VPNLSNSGPSLSSSTKAVMILLETSTGSAAEDASSGERLP